MVKVNLEELRTTFPGNPSKAFEDMCTLMFCTKLGLSHGVNRRINQMGIESEPVRIGNKVYAYQAKFYGPNTALSEHKGDLIKAIKAAREEGVTDLMLFINKDKPDKKRSKEEPDNRLPKDEPDNKPSKDERPKEYKYMIEINAAAKGKKVS